MADIVDSALKDMGAAGAAISVLMTVVTVQAGAIAVQWRQSNKVTGYRLAERDTLNKALTDSTAALNALTRSTTERNEITEELADSIAKQGVAFERVNDRIALQHDALKDDIRNHGLIITSIADALRTLTAMVTEVRNGLPQTQRQPRRGV